MLRELDFQAFRFSFLSRITIVQQFGSPYKNKSNDLKLKDVPRRAQHILNWFETTNHSN